MVIELNGISYCPIHNHRGNIACLVDLSAGKAKETYRYTAFREQEVYDESGKRLERSKLNNPWGFASKPFDAESGFVHAITQIPGITVTQLFMQQHS